MKIIRYVLLGFAGLLACGAILGAIVGPQEAARAIETPARAEVIDAKLASVRCSAAGAARLRNPQTARYIWRDEIVTPGKAQNSWVVILPVRAANGLGMMTNGRFVCILKNGRVVEIAGP